MTISDVLYCWKLILLGKLTASERGMRTDITEFKRSLKSMSQLMYKESETFTMDLDNTMIALCNPWVDLN